MNADMIIRELKTYDEAAILPLYEAVGWTAYTDEPEKLKMGFENSLLCLGAYERNKLLGLIRVVGDGYTVVFIQDILIYPEHQRKGIGSALLRAVIERYADVRQLQLTADNDPKTIAFYKTQGLKELSQIGCCGFMR